MTPYEENTSQELRLLAAAATGRSKEAKLMIQQGIDVNAKGVYGETALHWAAARGDADLAKCLMDAGAYTSTVNNYDATPSDVATSFGHAELGRMLGERRLQEEWTPTSQLRAKALKRQKPPTGAER